MNTPIIGEVAKKLGAKWKEMDDDAKQVRFIMCSWPQKLTYFR